MENVSKIVGSHRLILLFGSTVIETGREKV